MDTILFKIEIIAQKWFAFMTASSIQLGLFLFLIFIIASIFKKQSARFLYFVWLIGLLKIFIPPTIKLPAFISSSKFIIDNQIPALLIPEFHITTVNTPALSYQGYLFITWSAVVLTLMCYWLYQLIQFHIKVTRSCIEITGQSLFDKQILNGDKVRIFTGTGISMPFTRGIVKPKIYLPESVLSWHENELKALILHEYAHIRRKDLLFITLQNFVQLLFFFHPLVWLANRKISRYREKACDDFAIQTLQGKALEYGKLLLKSIDEALDWKPIPSMSTYFHQSKKFLINRFHYILNRKEHIMTKLNLSQKLILTGLMILGIAFSCQKKEQPSQLIQSQEQNGITIKDAPDLEVPPLQPPSADDAAVFFVAYDEPPKPIGDFAAIQQNLIYPELARRAGIEGQVTVYAHVGVDGEVVNTRIIQSLGENNGCDEAAVAAIKAVKWQPAKAKGQPVSVWVSIPVRFKLSGDSPIKAEQITDNLEELKARMKEMPPPPLEGSGEYFVPYDQPPEPIGGFEVVQKNLIYPELARKAGIEGTVTVYARIGENGDVIYTKILVPLGESGCNEAAVEAIKSVRWKPAEANGKPIAVWVAVPVRFKLQ